MSEQMGGYDDDETGVPMAPTTQSAAITSVDKPKDQVPTAQEVNEVLSKLLKGRSILRVTKETSDDQGLYELEIETEGKLPGEITEYAYRRFAAPLFPSVNVTYYDDTGFPAGGTLAAECRNGEWNFVEDEPLVVTP